MEFQLKCEVCGGSPAEGISLYRTGGKGSGINPHWRCEQHLSAPADPTVVEIVQLLEKAGKDNV